MVALNGQLDVMYYIYSYYKKYTHNITSVLKAKSHKNSITLKGIEYQKIYYETKNICIL